MNHLIMFSVYEAHNWGVGTDKISPKSLFIFISWFLLQMFNITMSTISKNLPGTLLVKIWQNIQRSCIHCRTDYQVWSSFSQPWKATNLFYCSTLFQRLPLNFSKWSKQTSEFRQLVPACIETVQTNEIKINFVNICQALLWLDAIPEINNVSRFPATCHQCSRNFIPKCMTGHAGICVCLPCQ